MNDALQSLLQHATRLTREGRLAEATEAIQRGLQGRDAAAQAAPPATQGDADAMVIDGCVFEVADEPRHEPVLKQEPETVRHAAPEPVREASPAPAPERATEASAPAAAHAGAGEFIRMPVTQGPLPLAGKLYVPPGHAGRALPLVVMLHGCTQNADDFAAGTSMNELAREQGFFVLYPEQAQGANPQHCWNWFKHNHQARGRGEPAAIAAATQEVMHRYGIDARRVYIAGLSAGGAMAHVLALAYPELFAAVGVHSGLPCGAAGNVAEALALMKNGHTTGNSAAGRLRRGPGLATAPMPTPAPAAGERPAAVPTIVFHGDRDTTVHPLNGEKVVAAAVAQAHAAHRADPATSHDAAPRTEQGVSRQGRPYTRSTRSDALGQVITEHWVVHGAGHAWSGGRAAGSYTDPKGPDASAEMLRFFFAHPRA